MGIENKNQNLTHEQMHALGMEHHHDGEHVHADGTAHSHGHSHGHGHPHEHPNSKAVSNRLAKAIGHLEKVKRMVDEGEDCSEVLIQLAAVRSAINNAGKIILMDHLDHCIVDAVAENDMEALKEFEKAIQQFVK